MIRPAIKLMADYGCYPLWHSSYFALTINEQNRMVALPLIDPAENKAGDIDPGTLPLSDMLREKLNTWQDSLDDTYDHDDPAESGFGTREQMNDFNQIGHDLWLSLIEELKDKYQVVFKPFGNSGILISSQYPQVRYSLSTEALQALATRK